MNKQYVIAIDSKYVCLLETERTIELVADVKDATFFDSEQFAYDAMTKNTRAFYTPTNLFYRIECVVVVWGGDV